MTEKVARLLEGVLQEKIAVKDDLYSEVRERLSGKKGQVVSAIRKLPTDKHIVFEMDDAGGGMSNELDSLEIYAVVNKKMVSILPVTIIHSKKIQSLEKAAQSIDRAIKEWFEECWDESGLGGKAKASLRWHDSGTLLSLEESQLNEKLTRPHKGEEKQEFISRFMGSELAKKEFPDNKQRVAVAYNQWERGRLRESEESYTTEQLTEAFREIGFDTNKYTTEYLAESVGLVPLEEGKIGDAMKWGWNKVITPTARWTWNNVARPLGRFAKDTAIGTADAAYQLGRGAVKGAAEIGKGALKTGLKAGTELAKGLGDTAVRAGRQLVNTDRMGDLTLRQDGSIGPGKMGFLARTGRNIFNAAGELAGGLAKTGVKTGAELVKGVAETGVKAGAELGKGAANAAVAQGKGIGRGAYSAVTNKEADYDDLFKPVMESYTTEELSQLFEEMNLDTDKYTFEYLAEQLGFERE